MSSLVSVPECEPGAVPDGSILSGGGGRDLLFPSHTFSAAFVVFFGAFFFLLFSFSCFFLDLSGAGIQERLRLFSHTLTCSPAPAAVT